MSGTNLQVTIQTSAAQLKKLADGLDFVRHTDVLVGIPQEKNGSKANGVTNAELLYIHTYGSPVHNIPPRPVLIPAVQDPQTRPRLQKLMGEAMKQALGGNVSGAERIYNQAGMLAANAAQKYVRDGNNLAPNAPSTVKRKGSSRPLIDTGAMMQNITYVVRKKGK